MKELTEDGKQALSGVSVRLYGRLAIEVAEGRQRAVLEDKLSGKALYYWEWFVAFPGDRMILMNSDAAVEVLLTPAEE